jgi:hypothetical protein
MCLQMHTYTHVFQQEIETYMAHQNHELLPCLPIL